MHEVTYSATVCLLKAARRETWIVDSEFGSQVPYVLFIIDSFFERFELVAHVLNCKIKLVVTAKQIRFSMAKAVNMGNSSLVFRKTFGYITSLHYAYFAVDEIIEHCFYPSNSQSSKSKENSKSFYFNRSRHLAYLLCI